MRHRHRDRSPRGDPARDARCSAARAGGRRRAAHRRAATARSPLGQRREVHRRRTSPSSTRWRTRSCPTPRSPRARRRRRSGAFMALMVTDTLRRRDDQQVFRDGMRTLDEASMKEQRRRLRAGDAAAAPRPAPAARPRAEGRQRTRGKRGRRRATTRRRGRPARPPRKTDTSAAVARSTCPTSGRRTRRARATRAAPRRSRRSRRAHYFRMMKELALLGYFTSEIGYTKAMRYVESPGRFDPCMPYTTGEPAWAPHA